MFSRGRGEGQLPDGRYGYGILAMASIEDASNQLADFGCWHFRATDHRGILLADEMKRELCLAGHQEC